MGPGRRPAREIRRLSGAALRLVVACLAMGACARGGARVVIGSKNFTEQDILGEIVAQQLERSGIAVERRFHLGGTFVCHQALTAGEVDAYVEYTGTALVAILKDSSGVTDPDTALSRVRAAYRDRFAAEWLAPLGFNNTFAMIVRSADTAGVHTLTQAAGRARPWRGGFGYEFMERADGFAGLQRVYHLPFAGSPRVMDLGLTYRALADGQVDMIAGNSTDGQIEALHLVALADDRHYFPPYQAAVVGRAETLRRPAVRSALDALAGRIDDATMRRMNYLVDVEHRDVPAVAREFLATVPGSAH